MLVRYWLVTVVAAVEERLLCDLCRMQRGPTQASNQRCGTERPSLGPAKLPRGRRRACAFLKHLAARTLGPAAERAIDTALRLTSHLASRTPCARNTQIASTHNGLHVPQLLLRPGLATVLLRLRGRPSCHERLPDIEARLARLLLQSPAHATMLDRRPRSEAQPAEPAHRSPPGQPFAWTTHFARRRLCQSLTRARSPAADVLTRIGFATQDAASVERTHAVQLDARPRHFATGADDCRRGAVHRQRLGIAIIVDIDGLVTVDINFQRRGHRHGLRRCRTGCPGADQHAAVESE